jgi:hypothetical protein
MALDVPNDQQHLLMYVHDPCMHVPAERYSLAQVLV